MSAEPRTVSDIEVRSVIDEEAAFFFEHGWVHLPGLISEADAADLRAEGEQLLAAADTEVELQKTSQGLGVRAAQLPQSKPLNFPSKSSELFASLAFSRQLGRNAGG